VTPPVVRRVLIANRGEIAWRIVRACRDEGLQSVAVYSDADRDAPFVRAADAAVHLGGSAPADSYLDIPKILDAARATGADAVHPGYGFLSERAAFAQAVTDAGLVFVGPPASAIAAMGDKTSARRLMQQAGVPIVPGTTAPVRDADEAGAIAADIGYPVLAKAAAGGGGRGMRVVRDASELAGALTAAASEARKAFGDDAIYLEKFIERPRHVEIQVLADDQRTIHLGERECSIQRRHQKLVEESPSIAVDESLRERMGAAAVAAAEAVGYRSAGTCEFLLAADGQFYFLEMNTRIQVEHPVTELVYGVDLVREQLRIARGLPMSLAGGAMQPRGWAIECRITSEDPFNGMLPGGGTISWLRVPEGPGVRWDSGITAGSEVTLFYDSLLAKLIVWAADRSRAIDVMQRALDELMIVGVTTNVPFHRRLFADAAFVSGDIDIQLLDRRPDLAAPALDRAALQRVAIIAALLADAGRTVRRRPLTSDNPVGVAHGSRWTAAARRDGLH
jgi:acetyl-CoA carboxylase biotin carboxylase subunit